MQPIRCNYSHRYLDFPGFYAYILRYADYLFAKPHKKEIILTKKLIRYTMAVKGIVYFKKLMQLLLTDMIYMGIYNISSA